MLLSSAATMIRFGTSRGVFCRVLAFAPLLLLLAGRGAAQEFRALWVDAFHDGMMTAAEVTKLVADARAGNFNAVIPQVRKRGDAYYNSNFEPKATDVSPQSFDPLADLCAKAHNTNTGRRIEVHAWIVTYPIWASTTTPPSQPNHPYNLHPDWLARESSGATWNGAHYAFDPGHPGVQQHTFNVAMDIISRYDVDGLNFDYVRYTEGGDWGYNTNAVARFNTRFNRAGQPPASDATWLQWRRDQVSALVRKVYLHSAAIKPHVKISADTICFAPGPSSPSGWTSTAAYTSVLQDWRAWMEEGILDLNIPMAYFDQRRWAAAWTNWSVFAKDHRYGRHLAMGPGIYLNTMSNVLFQMRHTRLPSPGGNYADGVSGYSYAVPVTNDTPASVFFNALVQTNIYETNTTPVFATPVSTPVMPWKTAPTRGHVKGFIFNGTNGAGFDAASVTIAGPTNRTLVTDATGFYGAVDLPPGSYVVTATNSGFQARSTNFTVSAGLVATRDLTLPPILPVVPQNISNVLAVAGASGAIITWTTTNASSSRVEFGLTTNYGLSTPEDTSPVASHAVLLGGLTPGTDYFFGVISRSGPDTARSDGWSFATAGDLILDNTEATFTGSWSTGTSATDKFGADYRFITVSGGGGATASAVFTPTITTRGYYDVFIWYPQGGNRPTNAAVSVFYSGVTVGTSVNQTINGGGWRQVGTNLHFLPGTNAFVRVSNASTDTGKVVMADAVRFVYRAAQDAPAGPTMPDWWAFHYFGANTNALADSDGDGYPNWAEYLAGTVPTNAASRLGFGLAPQAGALRATFAPMTDGRAYQLQQKLDPAGWLTLTNVPAVAGTNGQSWFTITNAGEAVRVLRLKVEWEP